MTRNNPALIDVLIPVYNSASTVESAIASILNQSLDDIRIIVVNDGSTDNTGEILAAMAARDARIHVVTTPNGGIVEALNTGLAICTAEFIARHDGDDLAFPDRFQVQIDYLLKNPDCVAVGTNVWHIDETGKRTGAFSRFSGDVQPDPHFVPSIEPYIMHPFLMVRRDAVLKAGGYRYVTHAEDTDLYWRLMGAGRLHNLPTIHGEYRVHSGSVSSAAILNGRIAAIASQLAAISYLRRKAGRPDIVFERDIRRQLEERRSFRAIYEHACLQLDDAEAAYLKVAATAKLLSLLEYRPYHLESDDCAFIGEAIGNTEGLSDRNRKVISHLKGKTAVKLLANRKIGQLLQLRPTVENVARAVVGDARRKLRAILR